MKRYSVDILKALLEGTTGGVWTEDRIGSIYRSRSFYQGGRPALMAEVKDDEGRSNSDHQRHNALLIAEARNFAVELLDYKEHRYGQEDCCGCEDRDAEIERLKEELAEVQARTAERCMVIASGESKVWEQDAPDPQTRIALAIKREFGIEDGEPCPVCKSVDTVPTGSANGVQGDGQEAEVSVYRCIQCKEEWSD